MHETVAGRGVVIHLAEAGWALCLLLRGLYHYGCGAGGRTVQLRGSPFQAGFGVDWVELSNDDKCV